MHGLVRYLYVSQPDPLVDRAISGCGRTSTGIVASPNSSQSRPKKSQSGPPPVGAETSSRPPGRSTRANLVSARSIPRMATALAQSTTIEGGVGERQRPAVHDHRVAVGVPGIAQGLAMLRSVVAVPTAAQRKVTMVDDSRAGSAFVDPARLTATVQRAQRGDLIALNDLLDAITPYVRRLCGPIALQDAPDAVQETLIVVLRRLGDLREPAALLGWVRVIAVREAVRIAKQSSRAAPASLVEVPAAGDPALAVDIRDVLDRLSPEHRAVLMLRDLEGLDEQTAGEHLGVPAGTVRSRLFRARRSFRKAWQTEGGRR